MIERPLGFMDCGINVAIAILPKASYRLNAITSEITLKCVCVLEGGCLTSLPIREMQIKSTLQVHLLLYPVRVVKRNSQRQQILVWIWKENTYLLLLGLQTDRVH